MHDTHGSCVVFVWLLGFTRITCVLFKSVRWEDMYYTLVTACLVLHHCLQVVKSGLQAGKLIGAVAKVCSGGGGGKPALAQAGGKDASKTQAALEVAKELVMGANF